MNRSMSLYGGILLILLAACGAPATEPPAGEPVDSQPQPEIQPSNTPLPPPTATFTLEPTATIAPSATPEGLLFRDGFNGSLQPGWTWDAEDPAKWSFVDVDGKQWLQIVGNPSRSNVLTREAPTGDFAIVVHVKADPRLNFHQANIFIFQDFENYIVVNTGFCQPCPVGGYGYFMETAATGGSVFNHYEAPRSVGDTDVYLKIEVADNVISGFYATTPDDWQRIGRFGNFYELNSIGLSATNSSPPEGTSEDIVAQFDYFEVTLP